MKHGFSSREDSTGIALGSPRVGAQAAAEVGRVASLHRFSVLLSVLITSRERKISHNVSNF